MKFTLRYAGALAVLLLLALSPVLIVAQDDDTSDETPAEPAQLNVVGSGVVAPLLSALAEATDGAVELTVNLTGTDSGLSAFCAGNADVALSTRPISENEEAFCNSSGVQFVEALIGNNAFAIVVNDANDFATCVNVVDLNRLFAPSAVGNAVQWATLNSTFPAEEIVIVLPALNTLPAFLLDRQVSGDGFRADALIFPDDAAVLQAVADDVNGLGVVNAAVLTGAEGVRALELNNPDLGACYALSAEAVEARTYPGGERLFAYVNATRFDDFRPLLDVLDDEQAIAAGYLPISAEARADLAEIAAQGTTGRVFSREVTAFTLDPAVAGIFSISGDASGFDYLTAITESISASYPRLVVETNLVGSPAGVRRLCNGEVDAVFIVNDLTPEQVENCESNNVTTFEVAFGAQATVLLANGDSDYLACLTTEQVRNIWIAQEDLPLTWSAIAESMPEEPMFLFAPPFGDPFTQILLDRPGEPTGILRPVTENNADPLYRAAATANVPGALTYMRWQDYLRVLENGQSNITLVQIDAGDGCVTPNEATIADGSYALARHARLLVRDTSIATEATRSVLWFMFSDTSYPLLTGAGYVGLSLRDLVDVRADLQARYDAFDAEVAARLSAPADPVEGPEPPPADFADEFDELDETDEADSDPDDE